MLATLEPTTIIIGMVQCIGNLFVCFFLSVDIRREILDLVSRPNFRED